jgi:hypothetical protein
MQPASLTQNARRVTIGSGRTTVDHLAARIADVFNPQSTTQGDAID